MECGEGGVAENQPDLKPKDLLHSQLAPAGSRVKVCPDWKHPPSFSLTRIPTDCLVPSDL